MAYRPNSAFRDLFVVTEKQRRILSQGEYAIFLGKEEWPHRGEWRPVGHGPYVEGYIRAAQVVWESLDEVDQANTLLYPAIFLARQAVELALKEAIHKERGPLAGGKKDRLWSTHDMRFLAELFQDLYSDRLDASWKEHHAFLVKLEAADPGGFFFRYCRDSEGSIFDLGETARCITGLRVREPLHEAARIIQGIADL
jgi:hypothetical protein